MPASDVLAPTDTKAGNDPIGWRQALAGVMVCLLFLAAMILGGLNVAGRIDDAGRAETLAPDSSAVRPPGADAVPAGSSGD